MNATPAFLVLAVFSLIAVIALPGSVGIAHARKFHPAYDRSSHAAYARAYSRTPQRDFQLQGRGLGE